MEITEEIKIVGIGLLLGVGIALVSISVDGSSNVRKIEAAIGASFIMLATAAWVT